MVLLLGDSDKRSVETLREVLHELRAEISEPKRLLDATIHKVKLGNEQFEIDIDSWFIHLDGSEEIVNRVATEFRRRSAGHNK
jgi:hypothetical protein